MFKNSAEIQLNSAFPKELSGNAADRECFGGEMRFGDMNFAEKLITRVVSKSLAKSDGRLAGLDMKKDVLMIDDENIDKFAAQMNNV